MIIWVSNQSKEILGYLSTEDFLAMTHYALPSDSATLRDAMEVHRTDQYIFGVLRHSQYRPTLRWSMARQELERIPVQPLKN
jgi:hypothetical protein